VSPAEIAPFLDEGNEKDVEACVALWIDALTARDGFAPAEGTADRCRGKFAEERVVFEVVRAPAGAILGFGLVTAPGTGRPGDPAGAAYLSLLAIAQEMQGGGWGGRLLEALHDATREAGHREAVLHVIEDNSSAVRLYERHGWREVADRFDHPLFGRPTLVLGVTL
jgi:ribosomal protein S18 acetylase RimI-like enzyme